VLSGILTLLKPHVFCFHHTGEDPPRLSVTASSTKRLPKHPVWTNNRILSDKVSKFTSPILVEEGFFPAGRKTCLLL